MDLFDCCVLLGVLGGVWGLSAFALMAAVVFLRLPPIGFGQALALTALNALVVSPCVFAGRAILHECYGRTPPPEVQIGFSVCVGLASMVLSGWLYRQFLEGVTFRKGVVTALLVSVIQTILLAGYFAVLLLCRGAMD